LSIERRIAAMIPSAHPSLPGHFPNRAIVPGVVMLERVAAAVCATAGAARVERFPTVKFLQVLLPDQAFDIVIEAVDDSLWKFRCESGESLLAQGSVRLA
jgi:3-hydroxyacyl-[acyl-carrier-protein] dehydratase